MSGKKKRICGLVDELPDDVKGEVDRMVANSKYSYEYISAWLYEKGYAIGKSSIHRYAKRYGAYLERIEESNRDIEILAKTIRENPNADYTDAGTYILTSKLAKRLAMADEEFEDMELDKAGRLMVALSRTKAYKDKVKKDIQSKVDTAFEGMRADIMRVIGNNHDLAEAFEMVLEKAKAEMMADD